MKSPCPGQDVPVHSSKSTNAAFRRGAVCIANFNHSKCNKHIVASFQKRMPCARAARARVVSHHLNSDGASPLLALLSPSNFHKMHTFLRVTCDKHMPLPCDDDPHQHTTYRTFLSLLLSYQTYPKAARLASLLPPSPLHAPPHPRRC